MDPSEGSVLGGPATVSARELTETLSAGRLWPRGLTAMARGERAGFGGSHHEQKTIGERWKMTGDELLWATPSCSRRKVAGAPRR
jgi:hypothetical protein